MNVSYWWFTKFYYLNDFLYICVILGDPKDYNNKQNRNLLIGISTGVQVEEMTK